MLANLLPIVEEESYEDALTKLVFATLQEFDYEAAFKLVPELKKLAEEDVLLAPLSAQLVKNAALFILRTQAKIFAEVDVSEGLKYVSEAEVTEGLKDENLQVSAITNSVVQVTVDQADPKIQIAHKTKEVLVRTQQLNQDTKANAKAIDKRLKDIEEERRVQEEVRK